MATEKTQEEVLIDNLKNFAAVSNALVGIENTNNTLVFMVDLISKNPDMYQKFFDPQRIEKLMGIIEEISKKKKMDFISGMAVLPRILAIYK